MADLEFQAAASKTVEMIYLGQKIGTGTLTVDGATITIDTPFEWPPDAIAIVEGRFRFTVLTEKTCSVAASYPGLLEKDIHAPEAGYFIFLIGARPQYNITTPGGDRLVLVSTGPFRDPEEVTGYELGISPKEGKPLNFTFRFI